MKNIIRANIQNLVPYVSARDEYTQSEGIFLDANESPYGVQNRYPDPYQKSLKAKIAQIKNVPAANIFLGNGSDEVIDIVYRICCEPGLDKALTFSPTYGMYQVAADINNVTLINIPLNQNFQIDVELLQPYLKDPHLKLIFICSPNNPTGNLLDKKAIDYILENFQGLVVIDEAYIDFCDSPSFAQSLDAYPNLIVCQTLSKAWAMAGVRLGIAFMSEILLAYFQKVKAPYNISGLNQDFVLERLEELDEFQCRLDEILDEKRSLAAALEVLPFVKKVYPSDANFLLLEVENGNALYAYLISKKIIIRNRNALVKNCLRITVGNPFENFTILECLKQFT